MFDFSFNNISSNTRLKYKFKKEKSKYSATDSEIFTDLNQLKLLPHENPYQKTEVLELASELPKKRRKSFSGNEDTKALNEDEAVLTLASLIKFQNRNNRKLRIAERIDSNLKDLVKVVSSVKYVEPKEVKIRKYKNTGCYNKRCLKQGKILKTKTEFSLRLFD